MDVADAIEFVRSHALTFSLRPGKLETLHELARRVEVNGVFGLFLEAGVAMGGSAIVLAKSKARKRELRLYDAFAMPPPPGPSDDARSHSDYEDFVRGRALSQADENYMSHRSDLLAFTRENMRRTGVDPDAENIRFVRGFYEETLTVDEPVAFAHVDCDWYDSVRLCIERIADWMSLGGIILFDDYSTYEGAAKAVDEWLSLDAGFRVVHDDWTLAVERVAPQPAR